MNHLSDRAERRSPAGAWLAPGRAVFGATRRTPPFDVEHLASDGNSALLRGILTFSFRNHLQSCCYARLRAPTKPGAAVPVFGGYAPPRPAAGAGRRPCTPGRGVAPGPLISCLCLRNARRACPDRAQYSQLNTDAIRLIPRSREIVHRAIHLIALILRWYRCAWVRHDQMALIL